MWRYRAFLGASGDCTGPLFGAVWFFLAFLGAGRCFRVSFVRSATTSWCLLCCRGSLPRTLSAVGGKFWVPFVTSICKVGVKICCTRLRFGALWSYRAVLGVLCGAGRRFRAPFVLSVATSGCLLCLQSASRGSRFAAQGDVLMHCGPLGCFRVFCVVPDVAFVRPLCRRWSFLVCPAPEQSCYSRATPPLRGKYRSTTGFTERQQCDRSRKKPLRGASAESAQAPQHPCYPRTLLLQFRRGWQI